MGAPATLNYVAPVDEAPTVGAVHLHTPKDYGVGVVDCSRWTEACWT
jgi:hypothetical protein